MAKKILNRNFALPREIIRDHKISFNAVCLLEHAVIWPPRKLFVSFMTISCVLISSQICILHHSMMISIEPDKMLRIRKKMRENNYSPFMILAT